MYRVFQEEDVGAGQTTGWIPLVETGSLQEANMIRGRLRSERIKAVLDRPFFDLVNTGLSARSVGESPLGKVRIMVAHADVARARGVIEAVQMEPEPSRPNLPMTTGQRAFVAAFALGLIGLVMWLVSNERMP